MNYSLFDDNPQISKRCENLEQFESHMRRSACKILLEKLSTSNYECPLCSETIQTNPPTKIASIQV